MSEKYTVNCDFCHGDISYVTEESAYRIRVMEEGRQASSVQPSKPGELERFMNFCNLAHLKEWLAQR